MIATTETASFRGDDDVCLVEASLACSVCLSGDVEWGLLTDDWEAAVEVPLRGVRPRAHGVADRRPGAAPVAGPPPGRSRLSARLPASGGCDHVSVSTREEAQPLEVMVELISRVDGAADESPRVFYDRCAKGSASSPR